MKKYVIMQAVAIPMFILALFIPVFITNSVIPVEVTTVSQANYTDDIYVNGFVEEKSKKIFLPIFRWFQVKLISE